MNGSPIGSMRLYARGFPTWRPRAKRANHPSHGAPQECHTKTDRQAEKHKRINANQDCYLSSILSGDAIPLVHHTDKVSAMTLSVRQLTPFATKPYQSAIAVLCHLAVQEAPRWPSHVRPRIRASPSSVACAAARQAWTNGRLLSTHRSDDRQFANTTTHLPERARAPHGDVRGVRDVVSLAPLVTAGEAQLAMWWLPQQRLGPEEPVPALTAVGAPP